VGRGAARRRSGLAGRRFAADAGTRRLAGIDGSLGDAIGLIGGAGALVGALLRYWVLSFGVEGELELERATAIGYFIGVTAGISATLGILT